MNLSKFPRVIWWSSRRGAKISLNTLQGNLQTMTSREGKSNQDSSAIFIECFLLYVTLLWKLVKVFHTTRKDNELFFFVRSLHSSVKFLSTHVSLTKQKKIDGKWRKSRPCFNFDSPIFLRFHFTVAENIFPSQQRERIMSSWVNRSLSLSLSPFFVTENT